MLTIDLEASHAGACRSGARALDRSLRSRPLSALPISCALAANVLMTNKKKQKQKYVQHKQGCKAASERMHVPASVKREAHEGAAQAKIQGWNRSSSRGHQRTIRIETW